MLIRQAIDFIRVKGKLLRLPQNILHGVFEELYNRDNRYNRQVSLFTEEFLIIYINSLEAAMLALETEGAIAMFADKPVESESLTHKLYFPFTDAMEQQDLINEKVQYKIDNRYMFDHCPFFNSLPSPVIRRLFDFTEKLDLFRYRTFRKGGPHISDPFYSAKVFRRTLNQAYSWFYADVDRQNALSSKELSQDYYGRMLNPHPWSFYEKNAIEWTLKKRDPKEEQDFILRIRQEIMVGDRGMCDFFSMFWELQERERRLSIINEVEAWVKQHR